MSNTKRWQKIVSKIMVFTILLNLMMSCLTQPVYAADGMTSISPEEYTGAIKNPLMGMAGKDFLVNTTAETCPNDQPLDYMPWATMMMTYIPWDDIETDESSTKQDIIDYCNQRWRAKDYNGEWHQYEEYNFKAIPRVYLKFPSDTEYFGLGGDHWPSDMRANDFTSSQFDARLERLISRLGELWDNDPRVAYIQMGIYGTWGEQHGTSEPVNIGEYFDKYFQNKQVQVRYHHGDAAAKWADYEFGHYNDSIGNLNISSNWQNTAIGGEPAYDYVGFNIHGYCPHETVEDREYAYNTANMVKYTHSVYLTWVGDYTYGSRWGTRDAAHAGHEYYKKNKRFIDESAEIIQKQLGYRYVIDEFRYSSEVQPGGELKVSFDVTNMGSAPMYYNWPVQVSLRDPDTDEIVWSDTFQDLDITKWLPGNGFSTFNNRKNGNWSTSVLQYNNAAQTHTVDGTFRLNGDLESGKDYMIQMAVLDPAGNVPSLRFAIQNYKAGGYHPMGYVGVGTAPQTTQISTSYFDDPAIDVSLRYYLDGESTDNAAVLEDIIFDTSSLLLASGGAGYDLKSIIVTGIDSKGNYHNLQTANLDWKVAEGSEFATVSNWQLSPSTLLGNGGITATYHGVTSDSLVFEVTDDVGRIIGTVTDKQGNAVANANVTLTKDGEELASGVTGSAGNYEFASALSGSGYSVAVDKTGYSNAVTDNLVVAKGETTTVNITLPLVTAGTFSDDFESGSGNWTSILGSWSVSDGVYRQTTKSTSGNAWQYASAITGKVWDDATYEVDMKVVNNNGKTSNWGGFTFRKTNQSDTIAKSGYYVYWNEDGVVSLERGASSPVNLAKVQTGATDFSNFRHLKIVTAGNSIKVFLDDATEPVIDVVDNTFTHGYAGLIVNGCEWHFDNVAITAESNSENDETLKEELQKLIVSAEALIESDFDTAEEWIDLQAAIELAKEVLTYADAQPQDYKAASNTLRKAMGAHYTPPDDESVKEELQKLIALAEALTDADFDTAEEWEALQAAIVQAKEVIANAEANASDYIAASNALIAAMGDQYQPPDAEAGAVSMIDLSNVEGAVDTEITLPVTVGGIRADVYRSIEAIVSIPEEFDLVEVLDSGKLNGGNLSIGQVHDGKLRLAYVNTTQDTNLYMVTDDDVLFSLKLKLNREMEAGSELTIAMESFVGKQSEAGTSENDPNVYQGKAFDIATAKSVVSISDGGSGEVTAVASILCEGDGIDLVPADKKAVSVVFTGVTKEQDIKFGEVQMYYSEQRSSRTSQIVYVALVDLSTELESMKNIDLYSISDTGAQTVVFGKTNEQPTIDAQDALNILDAWLRKSAVETDMQILSMNVTADARIDTSDVLAVVDNFVNSREFEVVVK